MIDIAEMFAKHEFEFLKDADMEGQPSKRKDLCAFILLDKLVPRNNCIIGSASHDIIYLSVDLYALAHAATEEDIITLIRLGVRLEDEEACLVMAV
jgi:hypothetical protein